MDWLGGGLAFSDAVGSGRRESRSRGATGDRDSQSARKKTARLEGQSEEPQQLLAVQEAGRRCMQAAMGWGDERRGMDATTIDLVVVAELARLR